MPWKTCPDMDCQALSGPRTLFCKECGEPFESTLKKFGHDVSGFKVKVKADAKIKNIVKPHQNVVVNNNITVNPKGELKAAISPSFYADSCGQLNLDPGNLFDDLYGKNDALSIIMAALNVYNQTGGESRYHTLIVGGASAGKTEIMNRIEEMVGKDNVLRFNAESASKAGMENEILNYPGNLCPVLVAEELDKCNADNLLWLLPALDNRRELIKVTAREGIQRRRVPFICIATANSYDKLQKMHSDSIASRFANKVFVKNMDDNTLYKILLEKLKKLPCYSEAWINPAIQYCKEIGDTKVRTVEAVLLCGQEKLLTGEYQATLRAATR